jgi:hypothetical protein
MNRVQAVAGIGAALLLAGCAAPAAHITTTSSAGSHGTVTGQFLREGGPIGPGGKQPAVVRLQGLVTFTAANHRQTRVRVGRSGDFAVQLPVGKYSVSGRSPSIIEVSSDGKDHEWPCSMPTAVTVTAGHVAKIRVVCAVP